MQRRGSCGYNSIGLTTDSKCPSPPVSSQDYQHTLSEYSGAMLPDELYDQPITLRSDIRPDTPQPENDNGDETELELTPSELEARDEHVVMRKGKARAS